MSDIEINRIRHTLEQIFDEKIDLSDSRNEQERASHSFARAVAAFAVMHLADCDADEAAASVVDGHDDLGIDAIYVNRNTRRVYFVSSQSGSKGFEQGDAHKFVAGFDRIVKHVDLSGANERILKRKDELFECAFATNSHFVLCVAHVKAQPMHPSVRGILEDLATRANDVNTDMVSIVEYTQGILYDAVLGIKRGSNIDLSITLAEWGKVVEPYEAYYGQVSIPEILEWKSYGQSIFDQNLRNFLPESEVNERIRNSLINQPFNFWYFNNGITIICKSISKTRKGVDDRRIGVFECKGAAVVNGAQTVGTIWNAFPQGIFAKNGGNGSHAPAPSANVHVRLIDLGKCPSGFNLEITKATNTQNRISGVDFASLDHNQWRLAAELDADGVTYRYRSGDTPPVSQGFTIQEATVALACATGDVGMATQAKRHLGSFWEDVYRDPYKKLFNDETRGIHVWRAVQILRATEAALKPYHADGDPRRLVSVHGNRFIASRVFRDPQVGQYRIDATSIDQVVRRAKALVPATLEALVAAVRGRYSAAYPQSLFKNEKKCLELDQEMSATRQDLATHSVTQSTKEIPVVDPPGQGELFEGTSRERSRKKKV